MPIDLRTIAYRVGQQAKELEKALDGHPKQDELRLLVNDLCTTKAQLDRLRKGGD